MTDKKNIDVTKCIHFNKSDISNGCTCYWDGECNHFCYFKQLKRKEQECEELKQWKKGAENLFKAQIDNPDKITNKYKQALDEIEKLMPKFDTSMGCDYGDYDCENCSDLDEDIVCTYKLKKVIKGIINKAKDSE